MKETEKSVKLPHRQYAYALCQGRGLDVGCGNDILKLEGRTIDGWDLEQGDAQYLATIPDETYDFLHSSHCLEHMRDVGAALRNWARVVKPKGILIITVPSWTFYEQRRPLPSIFNPDHKQCFCACPMPEDDRHFSIGDMIREADLANLNVEDVWLELDKFDFAAYGSKYTIDQTMFDATAQICYVFQKL